MNTIFDFIYKVLDNSDYLAFLGMVFLAVFLGVGSLYYLLSRRDPMKKRLSRVVSGKEPSAVPKDFLLLEKKGEGVVQKVSQPIARMVLPEEEKARKEGRLKLIQAGYRSQAAYRNYLLLKFLCAVIFPFGLLFSAFYYKLDPLALIAAALLAVMGFFLPSLGLSFITALRKQEITRALPDALDLMVVCVEAGLGLDMTFKRVGEEIRPLSKALSDEYHLTIREIRAGKSRSDSFRGMAQRTGVQEVNNLMTILVQASRFGTSIAKALRVHADSMRTKRRQIAEEKAAKVAVKLIFPLVLFIFPALMIVIGGPAFLSIFRTLVPALQGAG